MVPSDVQTVSTAVDTDIMLLLEGSGETADSLLVVLDDLKGSEGFL